MPTRRQFIGAAGATAMIAASGAEPAAFGMNGQVFVTQSGGYAFEWDWVRDRATVRSRKTNAVVWTGGLLPALVIQGGDGKIIYVKAKAAADALMGDSSGSRLRIAFGEFAKGELAFRATGYGAEFQELKIEWSSLPMPVVSLYFGTAPLSDTESLAAPVLDQTFWPNWEAADLAVPSAKGAPVQSVFRRWDLGHANLPLGSFGPALGTPYGAAYPKPLYAAAMGNSDGWICAGTGEPIDGALSLNIQSASACLHVLYREDLWGAVAGRDRVWKSPLRLAWGPTPWQAYRSLFSSFDIANVRECRSLKPQWNSWGDFRRNIFQLRQLADWVKVAGAETLVLDEGWESFVGSGRPYAERFPKFAEDLAYAKGLGLQLGFWQAIGWVERPQEAGLSDRDLIVGRDGRPRRTSWDTNPRDESYYCLDPSSKRAVEFLRERTRRLMDQYHPAVVKLDFGYGLPSPNAGVPRDPALRGERYCLTLLAIIADAARSANPDVAIEYYSVHPQVRGVVNTVALDDLGDAGSAEGAGHRQWSAWSSLAAMRTAIMASSGYSWDDDADAVLDTAVIGVPGALLSRTMEDGARVPDVYLNRRAALNRWYRRTTDWSPLWLNSRQGGHGQDPEVRSWGRIERIGGVDRLTALVLRDEFSAGIGDAALAKTMWEGRWALISQDDLDVFTSGRLACIPVDGESLQIRRPERPDRVDVVTRESETPWPDWSWSDNMLHLYARNAPEGLLGFVIRSVRRGRGASAS